MLEIVDIEHDQAEMRLWLMRDMRHDLLVGIAVQTARQWICLRALHGFGLLGLQHQCHRGQLLLTVQLVAHEQEDERCQCIDAQRQQEERPWPPLQQQVQAIEHTQDIEHDESHEQRQAVVVMPPADRLPEQPAEAGLGHEAQQEGAEHTMLEALKTCELSSHSRHGQDAIRVHDIGRRALFVHLQRIVDEAGKRQRQQQQADLSGLFPKYRPIQAELPHLAPGEDKTSHEGKIKHGIAMQQAMVRAAKIIESQQQKKEQDHWQHSHVNGIVDKELLRQFDIAPDGTITQRLHQKWQVGIDAERELRLALKGPEFHHVPTKAIAQIARLQCTVAVEQLTPLPDFH